MRGHAILADKQPVKVLRIAKAHLLCNIRVFPIGRQKELARLFQAQAVDVGDEGLPRLRLVL